MCAAIAFVAWPKDRCEDAPAHSANYVTQRRARMLLFHQRDVRTRVVRDDLRVKGAERATRRHVRGNGLSLISREVTRFER